MATYALTHPSTSWMDRTLAGWRAARAERQQVRETIADLQAMSDAEVAEMGLSRSTFRQMAIEAVRNG